MSDALPPNFESKETAGKLEQKLGKVQRKAGEAADEIRDAVEVRVQEMQQARVKVLVLV